MVLKSSFARGAAIYTIANIINASIPFLLLPILTRLLTPEDYGRVAMFGIVVSVIGAFAGLGVHGIISIRYFEKDDIDFPRFIASSLAILFVSSIGVLFLIYFFQNWLVEVTKLPFNWLCLALIMSAFQFVVLIRLAIWRSASQPIRYALVQTAIATLNAGISAWLVISVGMSWEGRVIGSFLSIFVFGILILLGLWNGGLIKFPAKIIYIKDGLKFGIPLIPHTLGGILLAGADRLIISNSLGIDQTGIYMVGAQLGMSVGLLSDAFVKAYSPWLYGKLHSLSPTSALNIVGATYTVFVSFSLLFLISWIVVFLIFDLLVSSIYSEAKVLLGWFLIGNSFKGMYFAVAGFFFFKSETRTLSKITISVGVIQVVLTWYSVDAFGITAAAVVFAFSNLLFFVTAWYFSSKFFELPWGKPRAAIFSLLSKK